MTADAESPFDILNLQVKAIRGKYGAKVVNDPEALSALLATERPDLKEKLQHSWLNARKLQRLRQQLRPGATR